MLYHGAKNPTQLFLKHSHIKLFEFAFWIGIYIHSCFSWIKNLNDLIVILNEESVSIDSHQCSYGCGWLHYCKALIGLIPPNWKIKIKHILIDFILYSLEHYYGIIKIRRDEFPKLKYDHICSMRWICLSLNHVINE